MWNVVGDVGRKKKKEPTEATIILTFPKNNNSESMRVNSAGPGLLDCESRELFMPESPARPGVLDRSLEARRADL